MSALADILNEKKKRDSQQPTNSVVSNTTPVASIYNTQSPTGSNLGLDNKSIFGDIISEFRNRQSNVTVQPQINVLPTPDLIKQTVEGRPISQYNFITQPTQHVMPQETPSPIKGTMVSLPYQQYNVTPVTTPQPQTQTTQTAPWWKKLFHGGSLDLINKITGYGTKPPTDEERLKNMDFVTANVESGQRQFLGGLTNIGRVAAQNLGLPTKDFDYMLKELEQGQQNIELFKNNGLNPAQRFGADVIKNTSNMLPSIALTAINPALGTASFGVPAAGQYARQAEQEGANPRQSALYGVIGGGAEVLGEKLFVDELLKLVPDSVTNSIVKAGTSKLKNLLNIGKTVGKAAGKEAFEEAAIDPVTGIASKFIYDPDKKWYGENGVIDPKQMAYDALLGGATGGAFASATAPHLVADLNKQTEYANKNYEPVVQFALGLPENYESHKMAQTLAENKLPHTFENLSDLQTQLRQDIVDYSREYVNTSSGEEKTVSEHTLSHALQKPENLSPETSDITKPVNVPNLTEIKVGDKYDLDKFGVLTVDSIINNNTIALINENGNKVTLPKQIFDKAYIGKIETPIVTHTNILQPQTVKPQNSDVGISENITNTEQNKIPKFEDIKLGDTYNLKNFGDVKVFALMPKQHAIAVQLEDGTKIPIREDVFIKSYVSKVSINTEPQLESIKTTQPENNTLVVSDTVESNNTINNGGLTSKPYENDNIGQQNAPTFGEIKIGDKYDTKFGVITVKSINPNNKTIELVEGKPKSLGYGVFKNTFKSKIEETITPQVEGFSGTQTKMQDRTINTVGKKTVTSYQYENPVVSKYIQGLANYIKSKEFTSDKYEEKSTMLKLIKKYSGATYEKISKAIDDIVNDKGTENYAVAKKVELALDDILSNGSTDILGNEYEPNKEYIKNKSQIEGTEIIPSKKYISGEELPIPEQITEKLQTKPEKEIVQKVTQVKGENAQAIYSDLPYHKSSLEEIITNLEAEFDKSMSEYQNLNNSGASKEQLEDAEKNIFKINLQLFAAYEKMGVSEFYTNSIKQAKFVPDEVKDLMDETMFEYGVQSNEGQLQEAKDIIDMDLDSAKQRIIDADSITSGIDSAIALLITKKYVDDAKVTGDYTQVVSWLKNVQPKITKTAQALQAISMFKKLTPEGILKTASQAVDEVVTEEQNKKLDVIADDAVKAMGNVEESEADNVAKEIDKKVKEMQDSTADDEKDNEDITPEYALANRIIAYTKGPKLKTNKFDPIDRMVNELFKVAKESPIHRDKLQSNNSIEFIKEAIEKRNEYKDVWAKAKAIVRQKIEGDAEAIEKLESYFDKGIRPPFSTETFTKSVSKYVTIAKNGSVGIKSVKPYDIGRIAKTYYSTGYSDRKSLVKTIVSETGLNEGDAAILANYADNFIKEATKVKKEQILKSMYSKKQPSEVASSLKSIEELYNLGAFNNKNYVSVVNQKLDPKLSKLIKEYNYNLGELVRKCVTEYTFDKTKFLAQVSNDLNINGKHATRLLTILSDRFDEIANERKTKILTTMFEKRRTLHKKTTIDERIHDLVNLGAFYNEHFRELAAAKLNIPVLTNEVAAELVEMSQRIQGMVYGDEKDIATCIMLDKIAQQIPPPLLRKVALIQTMSQLLNWKTVIRNIIGNAAYLQTNNISKTFGVPIDFITSAITGEKRTVYLPDLRLQWNDIKEGFRLGYRDARLGIDTSKMDSQFNIPKGKVFRKGALSASEFWLNVALKSFDRAFFNVTYQESLRNQLNASGEIKPTTEMIEIAEHDALKATFQDSNTCTAVFESIKEFLNDPQFVMARVKKGYKLNRPKREFGFGDLIDKYPKTPANIIARGIDFSPVSLFKSLFELSKPLFGKPFNQRNFVETMSQGIVGSGFLGAGFLLFVLGIITGKREKDVEATELQSEIGLGQYKINLSALKRFVASGLNPTSTTKLNDDVILNYDWVQPMAIPFSVGANISQQLRQKSKVNPLDLIGTIVVALSSSVDTLAEQPLLKGISDLFKGYDVQEAVLQKFATFPASFIPTAVNQARQLVDNKRRDVRSYNPLILAANLVLNKFPILSNQLPEQISTMGKVKETYQDNTNTAFNVLFNPAFLSKYKSTPGTDLIMDLYEKTEDVRVFPHKAFGGKKTISYFKTKIELSNEEYNDAQQYLGKTAIQILDKVSQSKDFKNLDNTKQVEAIAKLLDVAGNLTRVYLEKKYNDDFKKKAVEYLKSEQKIKYSLNKK